MLNASWKEIFYLSLTILSTERRKYYADKVIELEKKLVESEMKVWPEYTDSESYYIKKELKSEIERFERSFNAEFAEALKKLTSGVGNA